MVYSHSSFYSAVLRNYTIHTTQKTYYILFYEEKFQRYVYFETRELLQEACLKSSTGSNSTHRICFL